VLPYQDLHSKASQQAIDDRFVVLWGRVVNRITVGDIPQQREKFISVDTFNVYASKRQRTAKHPDLQRAPLLVIFQHARTPQF